MMLNSTFPQMLARLRGVQTKDKGMLLLMALVIVFDYDQRQLFPLKIKLGNFWPKEQANLCFPFKHQNSCRSETKAVFIAIFAQNGMHVNAIHL